MSILAKSNFDRLLTLVLAVAAVASVGLRIHASISPSERIIDEFDGPPDYIDFWRDGLVVGRSAAGSQDAPVTILVFSDYECPACAAFHRTTSSVIGERADQVHVVHIHYPLAIHRFALPAARAAECAAHAGRFDAFVHVLYANQDSLGLRSWREFAEDAGVPDPETVEACARSSLEIPRISLGLEFGERVGVSGTPTILVNGWRFPSPPNRERLLAAIDSLMRGRNPY